MAQSLQVLSPDWSWYVFDVHSWQLLCARALWNLPTGHIVHSTAPGLLHKPGLQSLQLIAFVALALCCPAGHGAHCDADASAANLPPSHSLHVTALAPLYLPDRQDSHDCCIVPLANVPLGQSLQYEDPLALACLPASQRVHTISPLSLACPTSQSAHSPLPFPAVNVPLAQRMHAEALAPAYCPAVHTLHAAET